MAFNWNRKRIDADAEDSRSRGQGGAYIALKDGEAMRGRFMPVEIPKAGAEAELYVRYGQHYLKDIETYFTCLGELEVARYVPKEWKCPFCALWKELRGSKDEDDQEEARKYGMGVKFMSNFRLESGDMRIFRYSVKTQPKLVELAFGTEYSDILDLKDGRDVEVKRKGSNLDTEYMITPMKKTYTIPETALGELHDIYAEIKVLDPAKMAAVLKGVEPDDDDYVTLRDLMGGAKPAASKPAASKAAAGPGPAAAPKSLVKKKETAPAPPAEPETDEDADRKPTKGEAKMLTAFGDELGIEIDMDNKLTDITEAIITEAIGVPKKKLSANFIEWLDANGCDVAGSSSKTVERKKTEAEPESEPAAGGDDEQDEVQRQIQAVRDRRTKK
jgi:hypothetical protein